MLSILAYDTEEEAIRIANDTVYGLAAVVQSTDRARRAGCPPDQSRARVHQPRVQRLRGRAVRWLEAVGQRVLARRVAHVGRQLIKAVLGGAS